MYRLEPICSLVCWCWLMAQICKAQSIALEARVAYVFQCYGVARPFILVEFMGLLTETLVYWDRIACSESLILPVPCNSVNSTGRRKHCGWGQVFGTLIYIVYIAVPHTYFIMPAYMYFISLLNYIFNSLFLNKILAFNLSYLKSFS